MDWTLLEQGDKPAWHHSFQPPRAGGYGLWGGRDHLLSLAAPEPRDAVGGSQGGPRRAVAAAVHDSWNHGDPDRKRCRKGNDGAVLGSRLRVPRPYNFRGQAQPQPNRRNLQHPARIERAADRRG